MYNISIICLHTVFFRPKYLKILTKMLQNISKKCLKYLKKTSLNNLHDNKL